VIFLAKKTTAMLHLYFGFWFVVVALHIPSFKIQVKSIAFKKRNEYFVLCCLCNKKKCCAQRHGKIAEFLGNMSVLRKVYKSRLLPFFYITFSHLLGWRQQHAPTDADKTVDQNMVKMKNN